jgi:hypothetical protein
MLFFSNAGVRSPGQVVATQRAVCWNVLRLTFTNLTAAGAPITLGTNDSFEQGTSGARWVVTSDSVVGVVPEPSSLLMGSIAALAMTRDPESRAMTEFKDKQLMERVDFEESLKNGEATP